MRALAGAVAALLVAGGGSLPPAAAQAPTDIPGAVEEIDVLPEGEGREETFYTCTACHNSSSTMRNAGTWLITHSPSGFGRDTRLPVSGSFR